MSLEDNKLSSTSNDCPYPKESPNLSLFPKQLDLLNEDNYSSIGTRILPQAPSINCQTPGWVDHVVNSSASSTTVGQNLNLPLVCFLLFLFIELVCFSNVYFCKFINLEGNSC